MGPSERRAAQIARSQRRSGRTQLQRCARTRRLGPLCSRSLMFLLFVGAVPVIWLATLFLRDSAVDMWSIHHTFSSNVAHFRFSVLLEFQGPGTYRAAEKHAGWPNWRNRCPPLFCTSWPRVAFVCEANPAPPRPDPTHPHPRPPSLLSAHAGTLVSDGLGYAMVSYS